MKFRSKKFLILLRSNSKGSSHNNGGTRSFKGSERESGASNEIKWEVRPSGMLVQKRESGENGGEEERMMITIKVSTVSKSHDVSIEATSTFGNLKRVISLSTGLHPKEQRLLYRGKEREDEEHLHMVGVGDKDKVLLLEDPAFKEKKLLSLLRGTTTTTTQPFGATFPTLIV